MNTAAAIATLRRLVVLAVLTAGVTVSGCRQKMAEQPRYDPYEPSAFFPDSLSARPVEPGTIARGALRPDATYLTGTAASATAGEAGYEDRLVETLPYPVTLEMLRRGQQRYAIFCAPCHDLTGSGAGMIVQRGLRPPPSFHTDRLRNAPVGHFFDVITDGYGAMYSYADRIPIEDRWAVIAYIRALQLSRHAGPADVPPDTLAALRSRTP